MRPLLSNLCTNSSFQDLHTTVGHVTSGLKLEDEPARSLAVSLGVCDLGPCSADSYRKRGGSRARPNDVAGYASWSASLENPVLFPSFDYIFQAMKCFVISLLMITIGP